MAEKRVLGPAKGEGKTWVAGNGKNEVPKGFPIKGNADSMIFHTPLSPWYHRTIAEAYFTSVEAAEAAGYRAPEHTGEGKRWVAGDGTNNVPAGFPIKGNADSGIYHEPDSRWYGQTVAEIYFATVEAAEAAGYHSPEKKG